MDQDIPHIPIVSTTEIGVDSGLRFTVVENFFFLCSVLPAIRGELSLCSVFTSFTQALATHWDSTKTSENTMLKIHFGTDFFEESESGARVFFLTEESVEIVWVTIWHSCWDDLVFDRLIGMGNSWLYYEAEDMCWEGVTLIERPW